MRVIGKADVLPIVYMNPMPEQTHEETDVENGDSVALFQVPPNTIGNEQAIEIHEFTGAINRGLVISSNSPKGTRKVCILILHSTSRLIATPGSAHPTPNFRICVP